MYQSEQLRFQTILLGQTHILAVPLWLKEEVAEVVGVSPEPIQGMVVVVAV
jgi:hypothetical protein